MDFSSPQITAEDVGAVVESLTSGWLASGPQVAGLEADLAAYLGSTATALNSCTTAIEIAVAFLGLPRGAKVAVPTWTFASTALAPARLGALPVLVDVDPRTLNLSAESLEHVLKRHQIAAVIAVHFGGAPFDEAISSLCANAGVPLIEDAAHALGARRDGQLINGAGSVGACYSFYATKNLTSGEGGALATTDPALAAFARRYRQHGMSDSAWRRYEPGNLPEYDIELLGTKGNLADPLAALARSQLRRFEATQSRRRAILGRYVERLSPHVQTIPAVMTPDHAAHLCVVVLPEGADRAAVARHLIDRGVSPSIHFRPLHQMTWLAKNAVRGDALRDATRLGTRALSLPLHPQLTEDDVDWVCDSLEAALQHAK